MYPPLYRHVLLPAWERLRGRQTMRLWAAAERTQWLAPEQIAAAQLSALQALLRHAGESCPWYRQTWAAAGLHPDQVRTVADFTAWPLLTRELIREHFAQLCTTRAVPSFRKSTGGSSGQPLHFAVSHLSQQWRQAMTFRGYGWAGAAPGSRQLYVWGTALGNVGTLTRWKQGLHHWVQGQRYLNCFDFTPARMPEHVAALQRYRPDVIVGYTNPLADFARYLEQTGTRPWRPRAIVTGAEQLHDFQRALLERVFGAPVFETYGSREFMLIGAECDRHAGLHLSSDNLVVEIVDEKGRPTPPGEEGQVCITDLHNFAMPFIRYLNGDRAIAGFMPCPCGRGLPLLRRVTGRQLDMLDTPDGRRVPGEFFPHLLKEFPAVRRFQVVQHSPAAITLRLVLAQPLAPTEELFLHQELTRVLGPAVTLNLAVVDDIPLTALGKLRVVVREPAP